MDYSTTIVVTIAILVVLHQLWRYVFGQLAHLPGPSVIEVMKTMNMSNVHIRLEEWGNTYGTVFKVPQPPKSLVVLNGHEAIHEALVSKGDVFAAKADTFVVKNITENFSGGFPGVPDQKWRTIRKLCHRHLKQYGDGMKRLESVFQDQAEYLVASLKASNGQPIDPHDHLYSATIRSIYSLISGETIETNSPWEAKIIEYERVFLDSVMDPMGMVLEYIPVHRIFDTKLGSNMKQVQCLANDIWFNKIKVDLPNLPQDSLVRDLYDNMNDDYDEADVRQAIMNLMVAGIGSTSNSLYAVINILIHKPDIRRRLEKEILAICGPSRAPTSTDRASMPYAKAIVYELLRYHSLVPFGFIRKTTKNTEISGRAIPAGTHIAFNFWGMHHDEKFWGDPWQFRPERFLNETGDDVVLADHPYRRNLMPFSAGPRVCLGETMALTRLFMWLVMIVQRLDLQLGQVDVPYDVRTYEFTSLLRHPRYEARFVPKIIQA